MEALHTFAVADLVSSPLFYPITTVLITLLVIGAIYWVGMANYRVLRLHNIPGPRPLPYIGNMRDISKHGGLHLATTAFMKKYGKVYGLCVGGNPSIVVGDPEILKKILVKDFDLFRNRFSLIKPSNSVMKDGLFPSRDEKWKRIRSALSPTFTSGKLKSMVPLMEKSCDRLVEKIGQIAETGNTVDMTNWFSRMTLEVILSTSFGVEANVQENDNNDFIAKSKAIFQSPTVFRVLMMLPFFRVFIRLFLLFRTNIDYFIDLAKDMIGQRSQQHEDHAGRKDLIDILLTAKNSDGSRKVTDNEIMAQSVTFLLAGHETSSNALSSTAYHLSLNPDIQERLRQEIRSAIKSSPDTPALDLANDLEYLDCVLNEVLRIQPPAHQMNRECSQDYKVNGITIPKGIEVVFPIYALQHDPDAWPEPDKFDPERFRGPAKESRHPFQFLPFGGGPRNCIGMRFAVMEVKLTLFKILSKYKFVRCPETQVPLVLVPGITLMPRDGVHVRVETAK